STGKLYQTTAASVTEGKNKFVYYINRTGSVRQCQECTKGKAVNLNRSRNRCQKTDFIKTFVFYM
ncbi:unnamed protein product, partial [Tenebrio molitor]